MYCKPLIKILIACDPCIGGTNWSGENDALACAGVFTDTFQNQELSDYELQVLIKLAKTKSLSLKLASELAELAMPELE